MKTTELTTTALDQYNPCVVVYETMMQRGKVRLLRQAKTWLHRTWPSSFGQDHESSSTLEVSINQPSFPLPFPYPPPPFSTSTTDTTTSFSLFSRALAHALHSTFLLSHLSTVSEKLYVIVLLVGFTRNNESLQESTTRSNNFFLLRTKNICYIQTYNFLISA